MIVLTSGETLDCGETRDVKMTDNDFEETRRLWDSIAEDWRIQVGSQGDRNRFLNSDPVLWAFAGDVAGLRVLDAGCGTGYLTRQLSDRGADATGTDFSERMIAVAKEQNPGVDFRTDPSEQLITCGDGEFDLVVSNYSLMDTPALEETMAAFNRVLKVKGRAVLVFSHPCFPQGRAREEDKANTVSYRWDDSYFERHRRADPPWGHFTSDFIWFHRPLSDYWKAFVGAGFVVANFEEPRVGTGSYDLAASAEELEKFKSRPYSAAFLLKKGMA